MPEEKTFELKLAASDLSWVSAALASYVADHDMSREEDYYRLEDQLSEFEKEAAAPEEPEEREKLEEDGESLASSVEGIDVEVDDYDVRDHTNEYIEAEAHGYIDAKSLSEFIIFTADYSANVEVEWEPDGDPTYVPYGDRQVLFDDGKGGIDSVSVSNGCIDDWQWKTEDGEELSDERVKELLGLNDEGFKALLDRIEGEVSGLVDIYAEEYDGYERPEPPEPDYDDIGD